MIIVTRPCGEETFGELLRKRVFEDGNSTFVVVRHMIAIITCGAKSVPIQSSSRLSGNNDQAWSGTRVETCTFIAYLSAGPRGADQGERRATASGARRHTEAFGGGDELVQSYTVVGTGEECPLCNPRSELRKGGSWRSRANITDGKKTQKRGSPGDSMTP